MKFLSSLDAKDRTLLLWCVGIGLVLAIVSGILMPHSDNSNMLPSSYLSGRHGALAAYETLLRSGYQVQRWERPLYDLADTAGPDTVVIFAQPFTREVSDIRAVRTILERGGRVLATGFWGGMILPAGASIAPDTFNFSACKLQPEGLEALSNTGEVWMRPEASWKVGNPAQRVDYSCGGQPAVVEYRWGKGSVVWWASSTPLENGSLDRAQDLDLLLNSLGPREGHHFYWDESLHGDVRSVLSYAAGPSLWMLGLGLPLLGLLVVMSFSRRSGPVRELPAPARATPVEFLEALGSLYRKAGAASTAVAIALEQFRQRSLRLCGLRGARPGPAELAATIRRRFPAVDAELEKDLAACEEASWSERVHPREALRLIQKLHGHGKTLDAAVKSGAQSASSPHTYSKQDERAS
jgi:hypothetical protein